MVKIDHGWAGKWLCEPEQSKIGFHDTLPMYNTVCGTRRATSTNHFKDWVDSDGSLIIDTNIFADTMLKMVESLITCNLLNILEDSLFKCFTYAREQVEVEEEEEKFI